MTLCFCVITISHELLRSEKEKLTTFRNRIDFTFVLLLVLTWSMFDLENGSFAHGYVHYLSDRLGYEKV